MPTSWSVFSSCACIERNKSRRGTETHQVGTAVVSLCCSGNNVGMYNPTQHFLKNKNGLDNIVKPATHWGHAQDPPCCTAAEKNAHLHTYVSEFFRSTHDKALCGECFPSCLLRSKNKTISVLHFWRRAVGKMTRPRNCFLCVHVCVCIRRDGNLDVIREVFVCPVRVVPNPRKNSLTTDVLYNQHLITVDHRLASFGSNVMQVNTHPTSIKVCFIKVTSNPFKPPLSTQIIKKIHALHDVH